MGKGWTVNGNRKAVENVNSIHWMALKGVHIRLCLTQWTCLFLDIYSASQSTPISCHLHIVPFYIYISGCINWIVSSTRPTPLRKLWLVYVIDCKMQGHILLACGLPCHFNMVPIGPYQYRLYWLCTAVSFAVASVEIHKVVHLDNCPSVHQPKESVLSVHYIEQLSVSALPAC